MTQLLLAVDSGFQVDVANFDFWNAFDTVDNYIPLMKLVQAEVRHKTSFLQFTRETGNKMSTDPVIDQNRTSLDQESVREII